MTNLEKLRTGTDEEVEAVLIRLAFRSSEYIYHEEQVIEFMNDEAKVNKYGRAIVCH